MTFNQMSGAPTVGGGLKSMMLMWETQKQNAHHLFVELPSDEHQGSIVGYTASLAKKE